MTLHQTQSSPLPNASCTQYALVIYRNHLYLTVEFASPYLNEGPRWYESKKKAVMLAGRADPKDRPRADGAGGGGLGRGECGGTRPALQHPSLRVMQLRMMPAIDMPERRRKAQ